MESRKNGTCEPISRAGVETQTSIMDMWTWVRGGGRWWGRGKGGTGWETKIDIYAPPQVKRELVGTCSVTESSRQGSVTTREGMWVGRGSEVQEEGDTCTQTADSLPCPAETNTTLQSNYIPFKKFILKKKQF